MNYTQALEIVAELAKGVGLYGRILTQMKGFNKAQQKELERLLKKHGVQDKVDLVLFFEQ